MAQDQKTVNQGKKALRLLETLQRDMREVFGKHADVYALAAAVHDIDEEGWATFAARCETEPPSDETRALIAAYATIKVEVFEFTRERPVSELVL